jgi:thiol-disulfide isomerase/thioredoxin
VQLLIISSAEVQTMRVRVVFVSFLLAILPVPSLCQQPQQPGYRDNKDFQKAWNEAETLRRRGDSMWAIDSYRKANKKADGKCLECLMNLMKVESKTGNFKDIIKDGADLEAQSTSPKIKAEAAFYEGSAYFHLNGDKPNPAQLEQAHEALQRTVADDPHVVLAHYLDGCVLARLQKDDAAKEQFQAYIDGYLNEEHHRDNYWIRAHHFLENPALARQKMAPPFTVTTLDGQTFSLDDMNGKVVLIDFWATWCGPCNEELPHMRALAKDLANEPFIMISISWDKNEQAWKDFIDKNKMTWLQYRDASGALSTTFDVHAIPHYFTIDSDGVLQAENIGSGSLFDGKLRKLIARAKSVENAGADRKENAGPPALANRPDSK